MIGRVAWFAAGAAAGAYGTVKARRAAYRLSGPGIIDQAAALGVGWRAFSADLRDGMREREDDGGGEKQRRRRDECEAGLAAQARVHRMQRQMSRSFFVNRASRSLKISSVLSGASNAFWTASTMSFAAISAHTGEGSG